MPGSTTYGVELLVELAIGRASDAGRWKQSDWGESRWGHTDTTLGDWVDVTCDVLDDVRLTAGSNTDDGVTRRWESASAAFTLDGSQWDPWNGPHADVIGDRTPARIRWRYPPTPGVPPVLLGTNMFPNPSAETNLDSYTGQRSTLTRVAATWGAGAFVLRATPNSGNNGSGVIARPAGNTNPYLPGHTYTAIVTARLAAPLTGTLHSQSRRLTVVTSAGLLAGSAPFPNVAGTYEQRLTFTMPTTAYTFSEVQTNVGAASGGGSVDYDKLMVWEGPDDGRPYYDGDTPDTAAVVYAWTGAPHASTSTKSTPGVPPVDPPWHPTFTGYIATRGYAWNPGEQQAGVACVDGTSVLVASDRVPSVAAGAGETAAARVQRIAAAALWPGALDVTAGGTTLQGTTLDAPAWGELLQVADTDLALLWITRAGALAYRPRGRVGQGTIPVGRLVVCPTTADDIQVMTLGRNQPTVTRNRVEIARRKNDAIPGDEPVVARVQDDQSIARYQAHDFKRTDLWHVDDAWSTTVAAAVLGAGAIPSPAPGELALDTITGDPRVPALLLTVEPDMRFAVVDDGGRTYTQAVVGWDMAVSHDGIEAVLHVEDVSRWFTDKAVWGTALWGTGRWGIGGN